MTGICVDFDSRLNQDCTDETMAQIFDSVIGCADRIVTQFLCGMEINVLDGDPSTAALQGNFLFRPPRELVSASATTPSVSCNDPHDCISKCRYLSRRSLGGAGTPPACSMCDLHCPNSFLTVIDELANAISEDILTVVRLLASCFGSHGLSGCICQLALTLQPTWRKVSTNPIVRCENGDAFMILASRIEDLIQRGVESVVNFMIDAINGAINAVAGWFGVNDPIGKVCWPTEFDADRCVGGMITPEQRNALEECEDVSRGLEEMCYYARVRMPSRTLVRLVTRPTHAICVLCAHRCGTSVLTTVCLTSTKASSLVVTRLWTRQRPSLQGYLAIRLRPSTPWLQSSCAESKRVLHPDPT
jgi:hypothetical protein